MLKRFIAYTFIILLLRLYFLTSIFAQLNALIVIDYPHWFLLLVTTGALFISGISYFNNKKNKLFESPNWLLPLLFSCRFLGTFLLFLLLLNPQIQKTKTTIQKPKILLVVDNSESMKNELKEIKTMLPEWDKALNENFDLAYLSFDENLHFGIDSLNGKGKVTDLSKSLIQCQSLFENDNVQGLILFTDGITNYGKNPKNILPQLSLPIYSLMYGDTTKLIDLKIDNIRHNDFCQKGNKTPIFVDFSCFGGKEKKCSLRLFCNGVAVEEQVFRITKNHYKGQKTYQLQLPKEGVNEIRIQLSTLNGEKNVLNNRKTFFIERIDNKTKVGFYSDAPHPDINTMKQSLLKLKEFELTTNQDEDLAVFHLTKENSRLKVQLAEKIKNNTPSLIFIGNQGANWLSDLLPLTKNETAFEEAQSLFNPLFSSFSISPEMQVYFDQLPPLQSTSFVLKTKNIARTLLFQKLGNIETALPQVYFQKFAHHKNVIFFGTGVWRWRVYDFKNFNTHQNFDLLMEKVFRFLRTDESGKKCQIFPEKKVFQTFENVRFSGIYQDETNQLSTETKLNIWIGNDQFFQTLEMSNENQQFHANFGKLEHGEYNYFVLQGDDTERKGSFIVSNNSLEKTSTQAQHSLLRYIAKKSNGGAYLPAESKNLLKELNQRKNKEILQFQNQSQSIFSKIYLVLMVILFTIEWFLRKYFGKI